MAARVQSHGESRMRTHGPVPLGAWGPVQGWEGLRRMLNRLVGRRRPRAYTPPAPVPFNIIKAKRCWSSKMGFPPRLLAKNPFELFENTRPRGRPWLQKVAPRLGAGPKIAFRTVRNVCPGSSKIAFSHKASAKKAWLAMYCQKLQNFRPCDVYTLTRTSQSPHIPIFAYSSLWKTLHCKGDA